jgi:hypothetical protein
VKVTLPNFPVDGGCACGVFRYRIHAAPLSVHACHCLRCQTSSGASWGESMPVLRKDFEILRGEPVAWVAPSNSGRRVPVLFCGECGTRVMHAPEHSPHLVTLFPGTLDDPGWARPIAHLWVSRKRPWVALDEHILTFEEQPADRQVIYDAFREATAARDAENRLP